jgi:hypothetical protein
MTEGSVQTILPDEVAVATPFPLGTYPETLAPMLSLGL